MSGPSEEKLKINAAGSLIRFAGVYADRSLGLFSRCSCAAIVFLLGDVYVWTLKYADHRPIEIFGLGSRFFG